MANTSSRRSGKLLTGIVAFLLGFIFAIVVEVGVIVGAGYFIMTQPLETIFATIGFTNADEDGNKFIDTDQVTTVMDLVNELKAIAGLGWDNMSIGDITVLSPALDAKLREWCGMAADYGITIDFDDLKATPLGDFEAYVRNDLMYGISLYDVVDAAVGDGGGMTDSYIMTTLLRGQEAATVSDSAGNEYVVYYDEYVPDADGTYMRVENNAVSDRVYPENLIPEDWVVETSAMIDGVNVCRQYYYYDGAAERYTATASNADGTFSYNVPAADNLYSAEYGADPQRYTGNYTLDENGEPEYLTYINADGEEKPLEVSLGYFLDYNTSMETFYFVDVPTLLADYMGESDLAQSMFEGITLGDFLNNRVEFDAQVDNFELAAILNPTPDEDITAYLCYHISNIQPVTGEEYSHTATYRYTDEDGVEHEGTAYIYVDEDGTIDRVVDSVTGEDIPASKVSEVNDLIENVDISVLTGPVTADDTLMAYMVYGITDITDTGDGYTAVYHAGDATYNCTIEVNENNEIITVTLENGDRVYGATLDQLTERLDDAMTTLSLSDLLTVGPSYTDTAGTVHNNNIMMFITLSATMKADAEITADGWYAGIYYDENDQPCDARIYVDDPQAEPGDQKVTRVEYTTDGVTWQAGQKTVVDSVSDQVSRLTNVLTIADIIDIDPDDRLMNKLGDYTINNIGEAIDTICISDAVDVAPTDEIMLYVAFGVTDVYEQNGVYYGTYHPLDGSEEYEVILNTQIAEDGQIIVISLTRTDGSGEFIEGTNIQDVSDRVENLQNDLAITTVIDIEPDNEIMMYIAYGVTDISVDENGQYVGTYTDDSGYAYTCYIVVTEGIVERVYYRDTQGNDIDVKGTPIGEIGNKVGSLTEDMSITSIIDIEPDSTIMMYIGYGISNVQAATDPSADYQYTGTYTYTEESIEHSYPAYIVVEEGVITRVYYKDANGADVPISGTKIADIGGQVDGLTDTLTIGEIIGEDNLDENDRILNLVKDSTISNLPDTIGSLTVQEMYAEEIYNHYYLVVGSNPSSGEVLYNAHYTYYTRNSDGSYTSVGNIGLEDMVPGTDYYVNFGGAWLTAVVDNASVDSATDIVFNPEYLYYTYDETTGKYTLVHTDDDLTENDGRLTASDLNDDTTYYTRGRATGIWYLLLYSTDYDGDGNADGEKKEISYSVNNMGDMMNSAVSNLNDATLQDFVDAGIITGDITGEIPTGGTLGNLTWTPIADMTIDELLEAVNFISGLLR